MITTRTSDQEGARKAAVFSAGTAGHASTSKIRHHTEQQQARQDLNYHTPDCMLPHAWLYVATCLAVCCHMPGCVLPQVLDADARIYLYEGFLSPGEHCHYVAVMHFVRKFHASAAPCHYEQPQAWSHLHCCHQGAATRRPSSHQQHPSARQ